MQKDLLTELPLAKLDFNSIQSIVAQNSTKLSCLLKESTEFAQKIKRVRPHFKGVVKSMVSDCVKFNSLSRKNIKVKNGKFIERRPLLSSSNLIKNGLKNSCSLPSTARKISSAVSTALHGSNRKHNGKYKCKKIRSFQTKCYLNSKILFNAAKLNTSTSAVTKSSSIIETGNVKNLVSNSFSSEKLLDNNLNQCSASDLLLTNSHAKILKGQASSNLSTEDDNDCLILSDKEQHLESSLGLEKESEPPFCVISEVIGNARDTFFSSTDNSLDLIKEPPEIQLIFPKKTKDITKIKGWRRKQFLVEKPTTIEFYSIDERSLALQKKIKLNKCSNTVENTNTEEPGDVKNAFVCDSLDEFLAQDAGLKINFEIPHLFAELGIKLTSNEIVSKPVISEKDIKEVETRYCVPVSIPCDSIDLDDVKEKSGKALKRPMEFYPKPFKFLKINEQNSKKSAVKVTDNTEFKEDYVEPKSQIENFEESESNKALSDIKLVNKFLAVVVYPGPFRPLHPIVQYHLAKIRNYRTKVDENWANFAASAVLDDRKCCKRKILPVQCVVKVEKKPNETTDSSGSSKVENNIEIINCTEIQPKLKKCSVVIEKLNSIQTCDVWCVIHNRCNCTQCALHNVDKSESKELKLKETKKKILSQDKALKEVVSVSPRVCFDKTISSLLAKKVRLLKHLKQVDSGGTLTSIDCLKSLKPNTVEFVKLKFVKESLHTGYINIWYLKPEEPEVRSRAFLTISKTSPLPEAINLKSSAVSLNNLPKFIKEIISEDKTFDSNEYAILHCNGLFWEIHGSLNVAFEKRYKNVDQVFIKLKLPELKKLQKIAFGILPEKAVKWWVLDLTQKFWLIEVKCGNFNIVMLRKKFFEIIASRFFGFLSLKKGSDDRVIGVGIFRRLLPFVLIGPYYLLETHELILKSETSTVPFTYYAKNNVPKNSRLKFLINSVIKDIEQSDRKLEGLWLYDKTYLDGTNYLEVLTADLGTLPCSNSSINMDHGYSLNSRTTSSISTSGTNSKTTKRKDEIEKITVYLYFDIFDLGFVKGKLQLDNSVTITHPLNNRKKINSCQIGKRFICIIKKNIKFIPKNLKVNWFVTRFREDLKFRRPFNKLILSGDYILTQVGVHYLLEMSESKIEKLGLDKSEIVKALAGTEFINEFNEKKNLTSLLLNDSMKDLTLYEILTRIKAFKKRRMQKSSQTFNSK